MPFVKSHFGTQGLLAGNIEWVEEQERELGEQEQVGDTVDELGQLGLWEWLGSWQSLAVGRVVEQVFAF